MTGPARSAAPLLQQLIARDILTALAHDASRAGVVVMPLKGVLMVALGVRPATERGTIDLDVLVSAQDAPRLLAAARERGWVTSVGNGVSCVLEHPAHPMPVDLHRALFPPRMFRLDTDGVLARSTRDRKTFGVEVARMHPLDLYAHLVGHFVKSRADTRHLRHVSDFASMGRWMPFAAEACAKHLVDHGLARAARYALGVALTENEDPYARSVLAALPRDRRGRALSRLARAVLSRVEPGHAAGIPVVHALNTSLFAGVTSLVAHVTEPSGPDRSRDGWWLPR